jgi:hypothetical protein
VQNLVIRSSSTGDILSEKPAPLSCSSGSYEQIVQMSQNKDSVILSDGLTISVLSIPDLNVMSQKRISGFEKIIGHAAVYFFLTPDTNHLMIRSRSVNATLVRWSVIQTGLDRGYEGFTASDPPPNDLMPHAVEDDCVWVWNRVQSDQQFLLDVLCLSLRDGSTVLQNFSFVPLDHHLTSPGSFSDVYQSPSRVFASYSGGFASGQGAIVSWSTTSSASDHDLRFHRVPAFGHLVGGAISTSGVTCICYGSAFGEEPHFSCQNVYES